MKIIFPSLIFLLFLSCSKNQTWTLHIIDNDLRGADGVKLGDVNNDGRIDIVTGWEESGETRIYLNPWINKIQQKWPFVSIGKTPSVEDAVFVDLNADGWLDVVTCCEGQEKRMFIHWNPGPGNMKKSENWKQQLLPQSENRMQWMFCCPADIDADGDTDLIAAGKNANAEIGWFEAPQNPLSLADYNWHPLSSVGWVMSILSEDMDSDGDLDIIYSDRKGELAGVRWLENPGKKFANSWLNHIIGGDGLEVMFLRCADFDQDGLQDILTATKPQSILFNRRLDNKGLEWDTTESIFPAQAGSAKAVRAADFDMDEKMELAITCEHAEPPKVGVFLLRHNPEKNDWNFVDVSGDIGIKFDRMEIIDMDSDGDPDILTCEERHEDRGLGVIWYENPAR